MGHPLSHPNNRKRTAQQPKIDTPHQKRTADQKIDTSTPENRHFSTYVTHFHTPTTENVQMPYKPVVATLCRV
jgi:hypothetical protein